ncbi:MAG: deoxyribodipyrimidine photo-lyase [Solirubrobacterales bacterium]
MNDSTPGDGPVIYWMSRDQRVFDNWGLLHAQELAEAAGTHVRVVFCLLPRCGAASRRSYDFMLGGLKEVERDLFDLGIPFELRFGDVRDQLHDAGAVVCDFSPLRPSRARREALAESLAVPLIEVDSRNIVPAWQAADKHVYAAFHLRNRYKDLLPEYLTQMPDPAPQSGLPPSAFVNTDWQAAAEFVEAEAFGPPVEFVPGEAAAHDALTRFVEQRLNGYAEKRGLPDDDHQSGLSPYLHFGQLSVQRAVLTVRASGAPQADIDEFIDEAVVWRELSDNFCWFEPGYASFDGFPNWARETLTAHAGDAREIVYSLADFEAAATHDELWNAAQIEMIETGKMHNYLRMYWAKKILEWSESPAEAVRIAVLLNDRYELDGRDSNGYAGIAWSIGGVHDRAWQERPVYGKIRYMNYNGAKRKFDVEAYIKRALAA